MFVRGEDGAREKFVEEKIRLYRGQICHDCNWTTHWERGEGAWRERVERTTTVSGRMRQARKKEQAEREGQGKQNDHCGSGERGGG